MAGWDFLLMLDKLTPGRSHTGFFRARHEKIRGNIDYSITVTHIIAVMLL